MTFNDETLLAVFDSLQVKDVSKDGAIVYKVRVLEEDDNGRTPKDPKFNERYKTVFHTLAERENKEVINHPAIRLLVNYKWTKWAKYRFMLNSCFYLFSLISLTISVAFSATTADVKTYNNGLQYARGFFEVVSYGTFVKSFGLEMCQLMR
ncbi:uncharacterized protein LOC128552963 [Mercenaria mercenaria]|uniref:uncharacterized protein LOC128552963 n=1 Tax=Mercenaria mercenaria TaxID=6596 RepID=UPI00234EA664|nr:uncharacterized protein LOC128552963 [Mercenaria mercenaria]